jgi:hypothetical protein
MSGDKYFDTPDYYRSEISVKGIGAAISSVVRTVDSTEIVSDASGSAMLSPSIDFLSSPELPELSFLLNELNGDELTDGWSNFSPQETLKPDWIPLSSEAAVLGEQIPAPEALDLNMLQSLLQKMQYIIGGSLNLESVDANAPLDQTLDLLKQLVDRQTQNLAAKQMLRSEDTSLDQLLRSLSHNTDSTASNTQIPPIVPSPTGCNTSGAINSNSSLSAALQRRRSMDKKTARTGKTMSKRVMDRKHKFDELECLLEVKRAQSAALEKQNEQLRRRQKMLNLFIRVRCWTCSSE